MNPILTVSIAVAAVALLAFVILKIVRSRKGLASESGPTILALSGSREGQTSVDVHVEDSVPKPAKHGLFAKPVVDPGVTDSQVEDAINRLILSN